MKVNPFKTTLYSSVLLTGLAATSVAAADENLRCHSSYRY